MQAPEKKSSKYADEGTAAHTLAEQCIRTGRAPLEFRGQIIMVEGTPYKVNDNMIIAVGHYVAHIWSKLRVRHPSRIHKLEQKVWVPQINNGGTVDSVIVSPAEKLIEIDDYKHGQGVYVSEVMNAQFLAYALGVVYEVWPREVPITDDARIITTVHQPRFEGTKPFRPYELTFGQLKDWNENTLLPAIEESRKPDAPLKAGPHCQFCRAKPICGTFLTSDRPKYGAVHIKAPAVPTGFQF